MVYKSTRPNKFVDFLEDLFPSKVKNRYPICQKYNIYFVLFLNFSFNLTLSEHLSLSLEYIVVLN